MPRICTCCSHQQRNDLDRAIAGPESNRAVARRFGVTAASVDRHRRHHLIPTLARSLARHEDLNADRLVSWVVGEHELIVGAMLKCGQESDYATMRGLAATSLRYLEFMGRLRGLLPEQAQAGVVIDARQQAIFASLTVDELRALARSAELPDVLDGSARELPPADAA